MASPIVRATTATTAAAAGLTTPRAAAAPPDADARVVDVEACLRHIDSILGDGAPVSVSPVQRRSIALRNAVCLACGAPPLRRLCAAHQGQHTLSHAPATDRSACHHHSSTAPCQHQHSSRQHQHASADQGMHGTAQLSLSPTSPQSPSAVLGHQRTSPLRLHAAAHCARTLPGTDASDPLLQLPDEVLLLVFRCLDGRSLARAAQVNRRWYHFVRDYQLPLYRALCLGKGWTTPLATTTTPARALRPSNHTTLLDAALDASKAVTTIGKASATVCWRYIFASRYAVARLWTSGRYASVELTRSAGGTAQASRQVYMMPMTTEDWGAALDAC